MLGFRTTNACNRLAGVLSFELGSAPENGFYSTLRHEGDNMFGGSTIKVRRYEQLQGCRKGHGRHIILHAADAWRYKYG